MSRLVPGASPRPRRSHFYKGRKGGPAPEKGGAPAFYGQGSVVREGMGQPPRARILHMIG
jgi:hypothetical protein